MKYESCNIKPKNVLVKRLYRDKGDGTLTLEPRRPIKMFKAREQNDMDKVTIDGNVAYVDTVCDISKMYIPGIKFYVSKTRIEYRNTSAIQTLKDLTSTTTLSKLARKLDLEFSVNVRFQKDLKEMELNHTNFIRLSNILKECPKVKVKVTPRQYQGLQHISNEAGENVKFALTSYYGLMRNKPTEDTFYKVETREQCIAYSLLQSYTHSFGSCQYYPVHMLSKSTLNIVLNGGLDYLEYPKDTDCAFDKELSQIDDHLDMDADHYRYYQDITFDLDTRYFRLNTDGTLHSRFILFKLRNGEQVGNNFYNMSSGIVETEGQKYEPYSARHKGIGLECPLVYFNSL